MLLFLQDFLSMAVANLFSLGRFLVPHSADDILFGNTFDRPLKLPWGTGAVLRFMKSVSFIFSRYLKYADTLLPLPTVISTLHLNTTSRHPQNPGHYLP